MSNHGICQEEERLNNIIDEAQITAPEGRLQEKVVLRECFRYAPPGPPGRQHVCWVILFQAMCWISGILPRTVYLLVGLVFISDKSMKKAPWYLQTSWAMHFFDPDIIISIITFIWVDPTTKIYILFSVLSTACTLLQVGLMVRSIVFTSGEKDYDVVCFMLILNSLFFCLTAILQGLMLRAIWLDHKTRRRESGRAKVSQITSINAPNLTKLNRAYVR